MDARPIEAYNGKNSSAKRFGHSPSAINLPVPRNIKVVDGVKALRESRSLDPEARVVMVTAVNQKEKLAECIGLGAMDFIIKPFDKDNLTQFFEKSLASEASR